MFELGNKGLEAFGGNNHCKIFKKKKFLISITLTPIDLIFCTADSKLNELFEKEHLVSGVSYEE